MTRSRLGDPGFLNLSLMLALTFSTGVIDAVGYLGLDRVFTGNMTGNVVMLGMALTGATTLPILRPILALLFFCVGAIIAGRVMRGHEGDWSRRVTVTLSAVTVVLVAVAILLAVSDYHAHEFYGSFATSASALAMGMQAATARCLKVADVTTVVVTSTITGIAADSRLAGGDGKNWARRFLAIALILMGACAGAAVLLVHISLGLALSALITLAVTVLGAAGHRRIRAAGPAAQ